MIIIVVCLSIGFAVGIIVSNSVKDKAHKLEVKLEQLETRLMAKVTGVSGEVRSAIRSTEDNIKMHVNKLKP